MPSLRLPTNRGLAQFFLVTLLVAHLVAVILIWQAGSAFYLTNPANGNIWFAFGRLAGLIAQTALMLQLVLISRAPFIERPFGFDKLNIVHRWVGYTIGLLMIGHPLLLTYGAAQRNNVSLLVQFVDYLQNRVNVFNAYLGVVLLLMVVFSSFAIVRKKVRYETWYLPHLLTYAAVTLIFLHQIQSGDLRTTAAWTYWIIVNVIAGGSILIFRFLRPVALLLRFQFRVDRVVHETKDVYSIYIRGRGLTRFHYEPGQYANLRFLTKNLWWQSHPFSFSTGPDNTIRFSIKASGDFTATLATIHPGTPLLLDGPLGQFVLSRAGHHKVLLIAGGIGITPLRALLDDPRMVGRDPILLYASRTAEDVALQSELAAYAAQGHVRVAYFLNQPQPGYESGYIDHEKIARLVPDYGDRDVFLCGPPPMMKAVVKELKALGLKSRHIHYERFSF